MNLTDVDGTTWKMATSINESCSSKVKVRPHKGVVIFSVSKSASDIVKGEFKRLLALVIPLATTIENTAKGTIHWKSDHYRLTLTNCVNFKHEVFYYNPTTDELQHNINKEELAWK